MTSLIIIAAFFVSALALILLGAILGSLLGIEKLINGEWELKSENVSHRPWFSRAVSTAADDEEKKILDQKLWDEGVANLLSYMGSIKGGDRL